MRLSSRDSDVMNIDTNVYANRAAFKNYSNAMDDEPYIVAEIDTSKYPATFALGDNSSTAEISDFPDLDYNGPLMEGMFYSYFVRFFSPSTLVKSIITVHILMLILYVGGSYQEKYSGQTV